MKLSMFKFNLPKELLAEYPPKNRDESKLMVVDRATGKITHKKFKDIINYFENLSLLVIGILLVIFPVLFLSTTTDAFVLPKQIALAGATSVTVLFFGLKTIADGKIIAKKKTATFGLLKPIK